MYIQTQVKLKSVHDVCLFSFLLCAIMHLIYMSVAICA